MREYERPTMAGTITNAALRVALWTIGGALLGVMGGALFGILFGVPYALTHGELSRSLPVAGYVAACGAAAGALVAAVAAICDGGPAFPWGDPVLHEGRTKIEPRVTTVFLSDTTDRAPVTGNRMPEETAATGVPRGTPSLY